ncbi:MAG: alpha/beta hydrolase [Candidatus Methylacidiphilales bacterium]
MGSATCIYYYADQAGNVLADNPRCCMDIFVPQELRPASPAGAPAFVWFHGGGFTVGDKNAGPVFVKMVNDLGFACVLPGYRLHPEVSHPHYFDDGAQALAWLQQHGQEHGIDTKRIFVGGISAGAYLVLMLVMNARLLANVGGDAHALQGAFILSGQMTTHFKIRDEKGFGPHAVVSDEHSPMFHTRPDAPPIALLVADNDIPNRLEENALFAAALRNSGHKNVSFQIVTERDHATINERFTQPADPVQLALAQFLEKHLR